MSPERNLYRPIDTKTVALEIADYVSFEGINLQDSSTYLNQHDKTYKTVGQLPFPYPTAPFPNYRAHHLFNFWIIEDSYRGYKNLQSHGDPDLANFDEELFWFNQALRIVKGSRRERQYNDYTGGVFEGEEAYAREDARALEFLASAGFDDLLCVSILPDRSCFGCQLTPKNRVGPHCYNIVMKDVQDVLSITNKLDKSNLQDSYTPFLQSPEGVVLGIVISKRNLYLWAGRDITLYKDFNE